MSRALQAVCLLILFISISGCAALMPPPATYGGYGGVPPPFWSGLFAGKPAPMTYQQAKQYTAIAIQQGGGPYLQQLQEAANASDPAAEAWLGDYYLYEWRTTESPAYQPQAFKWCSAAAKSNIPLADYDLALLYKFGWGTPADAELYKQYMQLAANAGEASAKMALAQGVMEENTGAGIEILPAHPIAAAYNGQSYAANMTGITATAPTQTAPTSEVAKSAPPAQSSQPENAVGQFTSASKRNSITAANQIGMLRVPGDNSADSTSANTGMKKGLSPAVISGYCLTPHGKKLCVFYRPAQHLGSNNRRRGLFIFNTHTGGMEKHFEDIERLSPTQVDGHYMFVKTVGSKSNLEVLDTRKLKLREIRLGKGVPFPWSAEKHNWFDRSGISSSNLKWVDWNLLGWGPQHHFFYVDCLNSTFNASTHDYFTLALGRNSVTVRDWVYPGAAHAGGMWTLFGSIGNSERIYVFNGSQKWIFNRRARRVLLLQGPVHSRLVKAGTGKVLATYANKNDIACSPNDKQIFAPYKIPGVHSRFIATVQLPKLKILQVIPVNHCTTSASKYIWTPDGMQILIITQQCPNCRLPKDGWGITFVSAASGKMTHFIPLANRIITQFSSNRRYLYVLNLGGKAGSDLLCIDLHNDKVVYKSVLSGSFTIGQKASVVPSPGKLVFVALGHTVFEVNASSGHNLGKLINMDPYVGHNTISKNGRRIYLATFNKAAKGASGLVAVSTYSGRIVRKFVLPETHIEIPPKHQGQGDDEGYMLFGN